jgi:hypothetical protein
MGLSAAGREFVCRLRARPPTFSRLALLEPRLCGIRRPEILLSITMEAAFCIEAVEEALARYRRPNIFNTDQGSQIAVHLCRLHAVLKKARSSSRWVGKGAWPDNLFVERLLRSIKYEKSISTRQDRVRGPRWPSAAI